MSSWPIPETDTGKWAEWYWWQPETAEMLSPGQSLTESSPFSFCIVLYSWCKLSEGTSEAFVYDVRGASIPNVCCVLTGNSNMDIGWFNILIMIATHNLSFIYVTTTTY